MIADAVPAGSVDSIRGWTERLALISILLLLLLLPTFHLDLRAYDGFI